MKCAQHDEVELTVCDSREAYLDDQAMRDPRIAVALVEILSGKIDVLRDDGYVTRVRFPLETKRRGDPEALL
jgi:hypothetical protein